MILCRSTEPARIPQHMKQATDTDGLKEYPDENEVIELYKCQMCDRKFGRDSYKKHVRICKTVFNSKRKKFDSTAHRTRGTAFAAFAKKRRRNSNSGKAVATQRAIKSMYVLIHPEYHYVEFVNTSIAQLLPCVCVCL